MSPYKILEAMMLNKKKRPIPARYLRGLIEIFLVMNIINTPKIIPRML
jgi:hypothetical protein